MSEQQSSSVSVFEVEVRTWPQRTDLLVIDTLKAVVIAHFPLLEPAPGKVADLRASYEERAGRALRMVEADQDYLRMHFDVEEDHEVRLTICPDMRAHIEELLVEYGLKLADTDLTNLRATLTALRERDPEELFALLCDWYDVVERHYPAGSVQANPEAWVHRASPQAAYHFHHLAAGLSARQGADPDDSEDAYLLFRELVDVDLKRFTFGHALRWVYFHLTEFPEREPGELQALLEASF